MSGRDHIKPVSHIAPRAGVPTVYANVEYPVGEEPKVIEIRGTQWVRVETCEVEDEGA